MRKRSHIMFMIATTFLAAAAFFCLGMEERGRREALCINELLASSYSMLLSGEEEKAEWIELYNGTSETVCLEGYGLSDDPDDPYQWRFPDVRLESDGFLLVYAGADPGTGSGQMYTGFRLSNRGGILTLTDPDGQTADAFAYETCYTNVPYGRAPDGGKPALLNAATPGTSNTSNVSRYLNEAPEALLPAFSHCGGFYDTPFYLTMETPEDCTIYYTLDGSVPDFTSEVYEEPIYVKDQSGERNRYASINTSWHAQMLTRTGGKPVKKGTIIRARICKDGRLFPETEDATYFVGQTRELPTISLITDPDNLFGYENGIYVGGKIYDMYKRTEYTGAFEGNPPGNYSIGGKEGRRPAHVEIFVDEKEDTVSQSCEMQITGNYSVSSAAKSIGLRATSKYGDFNRFRVPFFRYTETENTEFRGLSIRMNASFFNNSLRNAFATTCFLDEGLGIQAFQPAVLYINGEYWGVVELRERIGVPMIADHFGLNEDNIALLKSGSEEEKMVLQTGTEEDRRDYLSLFAYAAEQDMTLDENYEYLAERIDMDNLIRNYLAHIFFASTDWPDNNVRAFRTNTFDEENTYEDGKWRLLMYDMDACGKVYTHNTLLYAMGREERCEPYDANPKPPAWSTGLFAGLMDNQRFRADFLEIYNDYRQTIFRPEVLKKKLHEISAGYGSEPESHIVRWSPSYTALGKLLNGGGEPEPLEDIGEEMEELYTFCENRIGCLDRYMEEFYESKGDTIVWE